MEKEINSCIKILESGGLILYPTDTIWGIGCDATNDIAVEKIFMIKERCDSKALISIVSDSDQLKIYTNPIKILDFSEPTTVIYDDVFGISKLAISNNGTAGFRITNDIFCKKLLNAFGKAIISTSANISGESSPTCYNEISNKIKNKVDYIVKLRMNEKMFKSSTIIKFEKDGKIKSIRN